MFGNAHTAKKNCMFEREIVDCTANSGGFCGDDAAAAYAINGQLFHFCPLNVSLLISVLLCDNTVIYGLKRRQRPAPPQPL